MKNTLSLLCFITPLIAAGCASVPGERSVARDAAKPGAMGEYSALAIDGTNNRLASGSNSGRLSLRRLPQGEVQQEWQSHGKPITGIGFGRDGRYLVSAGLDGEIAVWSLAGKEIKRWKTDSPISSFVMSADQGGIVTGHRNGWVRHWRVRDHALLGERRVLAGEVKSLGIVENGAEIAIGDGGSRLLLWNLSQDKVRQFEDAPGLTRALAVIPKQELYGLR